MVPESTPRPASSLSVRPRREAWADDLPAVTASPAETEFSMHLEKKSTMTPSSSTDASVDYPGRLQLTMICIGLILGNFLVALDTSIIGSVSLHPASMGRTCG